MASRRYGSSLSRRSLPGGFDIVDVGPSIVKRLGSGPKPRTCQYVAFVETERAFCAECPLIRLNFSGTGNTEVKSPRTCSFR